jgi:hypothetical protein
MNGNPESFDDAARQQTPAQPGEPAPAAPSQQVVPAAYTQAPQPAPPPAAAVPPVDPRTKSPALACVLSLMPGLGQVYVGYYQRGFVHAIVVAVIITILGPGTAAEVTPLLAVFLAFFWMYNIIDAGRRASLYNQALAGSEQIEPPSDFKLPRFGGSVFGGMILLAFGFILLLHTRWDMSLDWIVEWWPLALMILGVYLLVRAIQERTTSRPEPPRSDTSE